MYIPAHYKWDDLPGLTAFMRRHSFALLVNVDAAGVPQAAHLPFVIEEEGGELYLSAHFARANPQWQLLEGGESLVIFSGPHAYISPQNYEHRQQVPTWNYEAVHAYGRAGIATDEAAGFRHLEKLINPNEPAYLQQWQELPEKYRQGMFRGIVPFRIRVSRLEGKQKLSQNKTPLERRNIVEALMKSSEAGERALAASMQSRENQSGQDM